jgi:glycine betaine/choline ABC-type transport system substrate-binding protein
MYAAVDDGTCTFGLGPGTEGQVAERRLTVLLDDRDHFYPYNAAPRLRAETLEAHPDLAPLFGAIAERLDTPTMSGLVARVELHGDAAEDVAADWLAANGFLDGAGGGGG